MRARDRLNPRRVRSACEDSASAVPAGDYLARIADSAIDFPSQITSFPIRRPYGRRSRRPRTRIESFSIRDRNATAIRARDRLNPRRVRSACEDSARAVPAGDYLARIADFATDFPPHAHRTVLDPRSIVWPPSVAREEGAGFFPRRVIASIATARGKNPAPSSRMARSGSRLPDDHVAHTVSRDALAARHSALTPRFYDDDP